MNKFATLLLLAVGSLTFAATTAQTSDTSSSDSSNLTSSGSGSTTDGKNTYQEPTSPDASWQSVSMTSGKKAPSHSHRRSHHHTKKVAK